ncbi:MAG: hypothetical protein K2L66_08200, partial [Paramuribaculum sp.]|nr:hypothetical protein [Paramuribaculum sp.]
AVVEGEVYINGVKYKFDQAIAYAEREISAANRNIVNLKQQIAQLESADGGQITALYIELLEGQIAIAEAQIPALEKIVADTKAALDAATAAQGE